MIECACGCEEMIDLLDKKNRPRKFKHGHNRRGIASNIKLLSKNKSTGYWRSKKIILEKKCKLKYIGSCKGVIDICHIDQNPMNNNISNLITLCRSHHRLMDNGKIDIKNPVMPLFYEDSSGKRRYGKDNS